MPCEVSGVEHLGPLFAAVGVVGAGQQQAGELAVGAGRGLQADVRQAADLGQRLLQQPHQLQRALGAARVLGRVQAGVAGQRRDPLVEARVVLHRAGAERVEAGVEVEVAPREPVVVADDLRLGDLGQPRRLGAQQLRRDQLLERRLGDSGVGQRRRAAARLRLLEDRRARVRAASASRVSAHRQPSTRLLRDSARRARRDRAPEHVGEPVDLLAACGAR